MISQIMEVFTAILTWFGTALTTASNVFYDGTLNDGAGGLTVIGIVSILTLGIGVITLVLAWVRNVIKGGN